MLSLPPQLTSDGPAQGCSTGSLLNSARWRLPGLLLARETESGQVEGQVRERVLTYRSSGVRMTETPDPANCASCPENYYSMCPVQKTKGPCDRGCQQCPAQGGPGPAPIRPSLSHLLHQPPTHTLAKGLTPSPPRTGRRGGKSQPSQPDLLALDGSPSWLREAGQPSGRCSYQPQQRW